MLKISLFYSCFWISLQIHNWDKWCHLVSGKAFVYKRQNAIGQLRNGGKKPIVQGTRRTFAPKACIKTLTPLYFSVTRGNKCILIFSLQWKNFRLFLLPKIFTLVTLWCTTFRNPCTLALLILLGYVER